jgi:hypothetical protein
LRLRRRKTAAQDGKSRDRNASLHAFTIGAIAEVV